MAILQSRMRRDCKTHSTNSEDSSTITPSDRKLYYFLFSVLRENSGILGYAFDVLVYLTETYGKISVRIYNYTIPKSFFFPAIHTLHLPWYNYLSSLVLCVSSFISRCIRKIAKNSYYLHHVFLSISLFTWSNMAATGNLILQYFLKICQENSHFIKIWPEDLCTYMIISLWILCRMRNISGRSCREDQNTFYEGALKSSQSNIEKTNW